jgi:selenocysteine lyase/cysteine desulfurase
MDVSRLQPTLVACSIQKWLRAPPGLSLVYIDKKFHDSWQPLDQHGRSRTGTNWNARAGTMTPSGYPEKFLEDARKFDSGGHSSLILLSMLRTSLTEVAALDLENCQLQLKELMQPLLDWAVERDLWIPTHHAYHLIGLRPKHNTMSVDEMLLVCDQLQADGIFVSVRNSVFRISPYITNTPEDIQRLIDGFDKYVF